MDKQQLLNLGLDYADGLKRFMGSKELYDSMLLKFLNEDDSLMKAEKNLEEEDWESFSRSIHTLKGVSANLSLVKTADICAQIMVLYRKGEFEPLSDLFDRVKAAYEEAKKAILSI